MPSNATTDAQCPRPESTVPQGLIGRCSTCPTVVFTLQNREQPFPTCISPAFRLYAATLVVGSKAFKQSGYQWHRKCLFIPHEADRHGPSSRTLLGTPTQKDSSCWSCQAIRQAIDARLPTMHAIYKCTAVAAGTSSHREASSTLRSARHPGTAKRTADTRSLNGATRQAFFCSCPSGSGRRR